MEWEEGVNQQRTVEAIGQLRFAHCSANQPETVLLRANKPHYEGLVGATWLLVVAQNITKGSPNNGPIVPEDCQWSLQKKHFSPNTCRPLLVETAISRLSHGP